MLLHSLWLRIIIVVIYCGLSFNLMAASDARCDSCDQSDPVAETHSDAVSGDCDTTSTDQLIESASHLHDCNIQPDTLRPMNASYIVNSIFLPEQPPPISFI